MTSFQNKVAVITVGRSGIGRATALAFAREGARVIVASRRENEGRETVRLVREAGSEGLFVKTDVSKEADVKEMEMTTQCTHLDQIREVKPSAGGCEECLKVGDAWVQLRICLVCGHVGCCDSSRSRHATQHFLATRHPLIRSFQAPENWRWCYIDETYL